TAVPQPAHRRMAPRQGLRQARNPLPARARGRPGKVGVRPDHGLRAMTVTGPGIAAGTALRGRDAECVALDERLAGIRRGEGQSLALLGEPGIGKSALMKHLVESGAGLTIVRTAGVESEMELPYASLQQLCAPLLAHLGSIPAPQREALEVVFALNAG